MPTIPGQSDLPRRSSVSPRAGLRDVHVKSVPEDVWLRARQNALLSGLPFKLYVIRLLSESKPFANPALDSLQSRPVLK